MAKPLDIPVPDLTGKLALVTGASDGVGLEIAARLARSGADILMPVRNQQKGEAAATQIAQRTNRGSIRVLPLDLASLDSVASLPARLNDDGRPSDLLIANAGVMNPPTDSNCNSPRTISAISRSSPSCTRCSSRRRRTSPAR